MKLVLRVLKTVLRNENNFIFKNRLKYLKRKCFSVLRQKQSCSNGVKNGCKNLQRFSFKLLKPSFIWTRLNKYIGWNAVSSVSEISSRRLTSLLKSRFWSRKYIRIFVSLKSFKKLKYIKVWRNSARKLCSWFS